MKKKILIIGGVAGGASAAARLRRNSEEDEIIMFEKGPHVSFSNCALPYHLSGVIKTPERLVLMSPEKFKKQFNIDARTNSEVISIEEVDVLTELVGEILVLTKLRDNKKIIKPSEYDIKRFVKESYDKLILSPGAHPIVPKFEGSDEVRLFTIRNVVDIDKINQYLKNNNIKDVAVIGGGFIGVEAAENLQDGGYNVSLVEAGNQILRPFDYDMVQILHKEIYDKGIDLIVEDKVEKFEKDTVVLSSGRKVRAQAVIMAIGVAPETKLAEDSDIELGETGAIKVDSNYKTNDEDIYAVGDAIEVYNSLTHSYTKLSLAGPAQKQARNVADHINNKSTFNRGYIGSSAIKVFDYNGASTGLNESLIKALNMNIQYDVVRLILSDKVGIMPDSSSIHFKMLYEVPTGKIWKR